MYCELRLEVCWKYFELLDLRTWTHTRRYGSEAEGKYRNQFPSKASYARLLRSKDSRTVARRTASPSSKHPHTKLCYKCQTSTIASLRNSNGFTHGTPGEIMAAAKSGCPLCIPLERNFDLGPPLMPCVYTVSVELFHQMLRYLPM